MNSGIKNKYLKNTWTIFAIFALLLFLLERFFWPVGLYFDDFGNASLSYGSDYGFDVDVLGMNWGLADLLRWDKWIYCFFSGRILCGSILNIFVKVGHGAHMFMAFQAVVIVLIFVMLYKIIMTMTKKSNNALIPLLIFALFFWVPSDMYRWNYCWASASVLYIWPLLPFFSIIYLLPKINISADNFREKKMKYIMLAVMIAFTAFSHEQTGFSIVIYVVAYTIYRGVITKKLNKENIFFSVEAILVYAFLFFAPGNWNRLSGSTEFSKLSFFEKITHNFNPIIDELFVENFMYIYLLISLLLIIVSRRIYKNDHNKIVYCLSGSSFIMCVVTVLGNIKNNSGIFHFGAIVYLLSTFACLCYYNFIKNRMELSILLLASAGSAFCVLISPTLPIRCFTEWFIIIDMVLIIMVIDYFDTDSFGASCTQRIVRFFVMLILMLVVYKGVTTYFFYEKGYYKNEKILSENDSKLLKFSGEKAISLKKLEDDFFAPVMPYNDGFNFIEYWMKEYYGIPIETKIYWE